MSWRNKLAQRFTASVLTPQQRRHVAKVIVDDAGHGFDRFGMSRQGVGVGLSLFRHLHDHYFRVKSYGTHNIPASGATIVVANHSGMLPIDGFMLWSDILLNTDPPRAGRPVADFFVPALPFINTVFARGGMIAGSRGNVHAALEAGELLFIFPEGVRGIGKPYAKRYQLQRWTVGHAELAIRHRALVLPSAVIGAEEAWPQAMKLEGLRAFGVPYLPIPATPLPMPTRFHLHYGEPIALYDDYPPEAARDPAALREAADRVRDAVADLIARGLEARQGVFR